MQIENLYQELIIDHGTQPRHFSALPDPNSTAEGYNPLCGDKVCVYLHIENNKVLNATFTGSGCAISTASASLMCEGLRGKSLEEILNLSKAFKTLLTTGNIDASKDLGKLEAFSGVNAYPARVKCATLAWHTLEAALQQGSRTVSTESTEEILP